jgi:hypothetical protein
VNVPPRHGGRAGLIPLVLVALLLAACGSSTAGGESSPPLAPAAFCQRVLAVLSDGPDPDADPVGYALSQIAPLGRIHTSDNGLALRLSNLIAADKALVGTNGSDHAATRTVAKDDADLNRVCPGVAP